MEAVAALRAALALNPADAVLWANYGLALQQGQSWGEAAACLERSLALSPSQPDTWMALGVARKNLEDLEGAETAYRMALQQNPKLEVGWQLLGMLKEEQKDFSKAIECFDHCVSLGGKSAALFANLGKLHYQLGQVAKSAAAYARAAELDSANAHYRRMAAKAAFSREVLEGGVVEEAIARYRNSFGQEEAGSKEALTELLSSSFAMLSGFGHIEAAIRLGRKLVELWPENATWRYLLSALASDATIERSPAEYVVEHFDAFAQGFDAQLVGALGYDIPEKLCAAARKITGEGSVRDTLDMGCGTGLCGPLLRPISRALTGVDLSPKMLEEAAKKGVYDTLACEELTAFLRRSPNQFDLVVAADLLIYFGDLAPLFQAAAAALRRDGLFAFSTDGWAGEGYRLLPSGRFSHAPGYVRFLAERGFAEVESFATTIRLEANGRLPGNIFVFRRREAELR
jgi:predicted TPR repeat methyltransferase